jgi:L-fuconolactonase
MSVNQRKSVFVKYGIMMLLLWGCAVSNKNKKIDKIDSHIHLYDTKREGSCAFLDPVKHAEIYYPHLPDEFIKTSQSTGITHAIVVEASKRRADNDWLVETVNGADNMLACIGNLDPRHPDFKTDLKRLAKHEKFRGIRIRPETPVNLSDPEVVKILGYLNALCLVLELGQNQGTTANITALARKYPQMNIIINHLAGGRMENGEIVTKNWNTRLIQLAAEPNIYCKISALYHLSGENPAPGNIESFKPLIDPVIDAFGPDRVLFGSNWTLSKMRGSYTYMIRILDEYCIARKDISAMQFYTLNALKIYGIENNMR